MSKHTNKGKRSGALRTSRSKRPRTGPSSSGWEKDQDTEKQTGCSDSDSDERLDAEYEAWLAAREQAEAGVKSGFDKADNSRNDRSASTKRTQKKGHHARQSPAQQGREGRRAHHAASRQEEASSAQSSAPKKSRNKAYGRRFVSSETDAVHEAAKTHTQHGHRNIPRQPHTQKSEEETRTHTGNRQDFLSARRQQRKSRLHTARTRQQPAEEAYSSREEASVHASEKVAAHPQQSVPRKDTVRLNKAIASAGVCSRRAADELILRGVVSVNGSVVKSPGVQISPATDAIVVDGKPLHLPGAEEDFTYIMLHKPLRAVTTTHDPEGRRTVYHLLPEEMKHKRVFPVGRLDFLSEGMLLLTDDGELTHRLTHPKWHLPKVYHVRIKGRVPAEALEAMRSGMTLDEGDKLAPVDVRILPDERRADSITLLEMTLIQGVNRQIRRMCRDLDLTVATLRRVAHGPVTLGNLERGKARYLTVQEVDALRRACGLLPSDEQFM